MVMRLTGGGAEGGRGAVATEGPVALCSAGGCIATGGVARAAGRAVLTAFDCAACTSELV